MVSNKYLPAAGFCLVAVALAAIQSGCGSPESAAGSSAPGTPCCEQEAKEQSGEEPVLDPEIEPPTETVGTTNVSAENIPKVPLGLPPLPVPEDNPMTAEKIALGKLLYFDKRLSKDGTISCATCHDPKMAWTEHEATSTGIGGQVGGANSPTVINSAYAKAQFWDGRAASLEEQALGPMENPIEMGHKLDVLVKDLEKIPEYKKGFQKVFGTASLAAGGTVVTKEGIAKAIAAFERTVLSGNSPYDQFTAGKKDALTDAQKRGLELFNDYCATCHAPPLMSNYRYYNAGVGMDKSPPDEGRKAVTGKDRDLGKFRVPPLREVAATGPYFHDGSVKMLEEAVDIMAGGGKGDANVSVMLKALREEDISKQDRKDLVEFLKALSGDYPRE